MSEVIQTMEAHKTKEYPFPQNCIDTEGYPTQEALDYIKNWSYETDESGELVYGKFCFVGNYDDLIEYIKSIWTYDDAIVYEDGLLEIHTYGWSGNEEIIYELKRTMFWTMRIRATQSGGHYYFKMDSNSEYDYWVTKIKN